VTRRRSEDTLRSILDRFTVTQLGRPKHPLLVNAPFIRWVTWEDSLFTSRSILMVRQHESDRNSVDHNKTPRTTSPPCSRNLRQEPPRPSQGIECGTTWQFRDGNARFFGSFGQFRV
jgi:hypothetical protein